jgi:nucleoside-diphosphate-sugar epimerase
MKVLVIGGAAATGGVIVRQLLERGCDVTLLNRGLHEIQLPDSVKHVRADPFSRDELDAALEGREFDLAIAMYGMLRHVTSALVGKTERLISVGGAAPIFKGWGEMTSIHPWETTQPTPIALEEDHPLSTAEGIDRFAGAVRKAENFVMQAHADGHFNATHFRYPLVYGPSNICPAEWGIVRRVLDSRKSLIVPGGGLTLVARGFADNMAHAILLAVEQPDASAGQVYNICDARLQYNHEWVDLLCRITGHEFDRVSIPFHLLPEGFRATPPQLLYRHHCVLSLDKIKSQLGYRDVVGLEEALERTVKWYTDHRLAPEAVGPGDVQPTQRSLHHGGSDHRDRRGERQVGRQESDVGGGRRRHRSRCVSGVPFGAAGGSGRGEEHDGVSRLVERG